MKEQPELEKETQKQIIEYLLLKGVVLLRINSLLARFGPRRVRSVIQCGSEDNGVSDLIGCTKYGKFIAIEVKRKGERATEEQSRFLNRVRENGGIAILAFNLEEVISAYQQAEEAEQAVKDAQVPKPKTKGRVPAL